MNERKDRNFGSQIKHCKYYSALRVQISNLDKHVVRKRTKSSQMCENNTSEDSTWFVRMVINSRKFYNPGLCKKLGN